MIALHRLPHLATATGALLAATALGAPAAAQTEAEKPTVTSPVASQPPPSPVVSGPLLEVRPGGLTAEQVAERAVAASPTLAARRAEIEAANAQIAKTTAQFFPRVTLSATYTRLSEADNSLGGAIVGAQNPGPLGIGPCDPGNPAGPTCPVDGAGVPVGANALEFPTTRNSYDLTAEVGIPLSDYVFTMPSAVGATRANAQANELGKQAATRDVAHEARVAYHDWLRAVAATSITESSLARTAALLKDARTAFELGAATRADVLRVEALVSNTELQLDRAATMRQLAASRLAILMDEAPRDYAPGQAIPAGPQRLPAAAAESSEQDQLAALVAEATSRRLELGSLDARGKALREATRASNATRMPRLDGFGQLSRAKPNQRFMLDTENWHTSWAVGLRLSYTINDTFTNGAQTRELKAQRAQLEAHRAELERGIRLQVTDAYLEARRARMAVTTAEKAHEAAAEAYRVSRELYRAGQATTTDLLAAENDLMQTSLQKVDASIALEVARLNLDHVVGRDAG
jgi:outer membrane protein